MVTLKTWKQGTHKGKSDPDAEVEDVEEEVKEEVDPSAEESAKKSI